jgi:hypothetical protein
LTPRVAPHLSYRARLPFRAVNHRDRPGYDPGLQRHHILPCQIYATASLAAMLESVGLSEIGFDDFRRNGMLLPCRDEAAVRLGLPLHCGPHRAYNALVIERVGQIEAGWARRRLHNPEAAIEEALFRLALLQRVLRRRLFETRTGPFRLNRRDPWGKLPDYSELDAMVELLWPETEV